MLVGIDHLVLAVRDPEAAATELGRTLGLQASPGGRHEQLGTFNRLVWFGDSYMELVGVLDRALAAGSWLGAPTVAALDAGGGLATYALASDDLAVDLERLRGLGAELEGPLPGERVRPDGRLVRWSRAMPRALGPAEPPFLIEHDRTAAEWTAADRETRAAELHPIGGPVRLIRLELPVADVQRASIGYLRTLGLGFRPSLAGGRARDASVGAHTIRLRPAVELTSGAAWPKATLVLRVTAPSPELPVTADILGCRFVLERLAP